MNPEFIAQNEPATTGRYIVTFREDASTEAIAALENFTGVRDSDLVRSADFQDSGYRYGSNSFRGRRCLRQSRHGCRERCTGRRWSAGDGGRRGLGDPCCRARRHHVCPERTEGSVD